MVARSPIITRTDTLFPSTSHFRSVRQVLLDPCFPAMRFLGVEPDIPIFAEQLIEPRRLEPFAIARAQHRSRRQPPHTARGEQSLAAIAAMIVVADPAVQRQPIDRFDAELAVGAGDFGRAAHEIGKRHAERRRRRAAAEARSLILDPEDRGDPVADVEAALIFPALVLAIGFEALRPPAVGVARSGARWVGKEWVSTCISRW